MTLVPVLIILRGITLADKIVKALLIRRKECLLRNCLGKMFFYQLLVFLIAKLIKDCSDIRLGDSAC